jgi:hypothetical protein
VVEIGDGVAIGVVGFEVEIGLALRVLAEETPQNGIGNGGFAYTVTSTDDGDVVVEVDFLVAEALEVLEFKFFDLDFHEKLLFRCTESFDVFSWADAHALVCNVNLAAVESLLLADVAMADTHMEDEMVF